MKFTPYRRDKALLEIVCERNNRPYPIKKNASHKAVRKALEDEFLNSVPLIEIQDINTTVTLELYDSKNDEINYDYINEIYLKIVKQLHKLEAVKLKKLWYEITEILEVVTHSNQIEGENDIFHLIKVKFNKKIINLTYDYKYYQGSCEDGTDFQAYTPGLREIIISKCETAIAQSEREYYQKLDNTEIYNIKAKNVNEHEQVEIHKTYTENTLLNKLLDKFCRLNNDINVSSSSRIHSLKTGNLYSRLKIYISKAYRFVDDKQIDNIFNDVIWKNLDFYEDKIDINVDKAYETIIDKLENFTEENKDRKDELGVTFIIKSIPKKIEHNVKEKHYILFIYPSGYETEISLDKDYYDYLELLTIAKSFESNYKNKPEPVTTVNPKTGQYELFQTEDRQLTIF